MRIIAMLVLIFGVALAGGAIYFASVYFEDWEARLASQKPVGPEMVNVIVAKTTLKHGTVLRGKGQLTWAAWPKDSLPPGVFTDAAALLGTTDVDPKERERIVIRQIEAGYPILEANITGFGERARMSMNLDDGMRAFSIPIDAISGVAGFVSPGDRVDILLITGGRGDMKSRVIMQDVLIIAVDAETDRESNRPRVGRTATIQVSPRDAQKLSLAQSLGRLSLTLRGLDSHGVSDAPADAVDVRDVFGLPDEAPPEPKRERAGTQVILRRGGEVTERLKFQSE
ncbi:MAG: Flp pilus assembly protein CpaB [Pikeienuella sp.]